MSDLIFISIFCCFLLSIHVMKQQNSGKINIKTLSIIQPTLHDLKMFIPFFYWNFFHLLWVWWSFIFHVYLRFTCIISWWEFFNVLKTVLDNDLGNNEHVFWTLSKIHFSKTKECLIFFSILNLIRYLKRGKIQKQNISKKIVYCD